MNKAIGPVSRYFVGIDGGGTGCRARLCDANGRQLGGAEGGAANVYLDFEGAVETMRDTLLRALALAGFGRDALPDTSVGAGLAGVSNPGVARRIEAAFPELGRIAVSNDGVTACLGAHAGADGGLVIVGTGSAAVLRLHGRDSNFGGRGFHLGDDGSGACLGRDLWRKALRAFDGLEPWTPLLRSVMDEFAHNPVAVIGWARDAASRDFAAYAPRVFAAAREGDAAAVALVQVAANAIEELVAALSARGADRISLVGGLAAVMQPHLHPAIRDRLSAPIADALQGALLMAGASDDMASP